MKIFRLCIAFLCIAAQSKAQQFSIINKTSYNKQTIIATQNGEWEFSLFPGNIIKTIFTPIKSDKNRKDLKDFN